MYGWRRYVPVHQRRRNAIREVQRLKKGGRKISPIVIEGRKITRTFWGNAWGDNLEDCGDYANRLPRGRTYVRNGSVVDLQIESGRVDAIVSGSVIYEVSIAIKTLPAKKWKSIKAACAGQIDSLVELLQGSISENVMEIVTRPGAGLFPSPSEISLSCTCPDWATMCKHVAATLYGVGARLDHEPELLFTLRGVDPTELVEAAIDQPRRASKSARGRRLEDDALSSIFGVDIDLGGLSLGDAAAEAPKKTATKKTATKKTAAKKTAAKKTATKKTTRRTAAKKTAAKKTATKKAAAKKTATKKATRRTAAKKAATKKTATKKAAAKKTATKKTAAKKAATKKAATKKTARRSAEEIATVADRLYQAVLASPGEGMRVISASMGATTKELRLPMNLLLEADWVRTVGEGSDRIYFPMVSGDDYR